MIPLTHTSEQSTATYFKVFRIISDEKQTSTTPTVTH